MRTPARIVIVAGTLLALGFVTLVLQDRGSDPVARRIHAPISQATRPGVSPRPHCPDTTGSPRRVELSPTPFTPVAPLAKAPVRGASAAIPGTADPHPGNVASGASKLESEPRERHEDAAALTRIRSGLWNADPRVRLESLRAARELRSRDLQADVALLLKTERSVPVRRVATQVLAQGDVTTNATILRGLKTDPDPVVQLNASFGLARSGDEVEQACLLAFCETSRGSPALLPIVAAALEDPALRSPAVIARFQQLVDDPKVSPAARERAQQVIRAKQQGS